MRRLAIIAVLVMAAIIAVMMLRPGGGSADRDVDVMIARGASLTAAAKTLEAAGAIDSAGGFVRHAKLFGSGEPIKPGEYKIKKGMGAGDILALLQSGKTLQRFVTIPEGMPSILVYERLMATELLTGDVAVPPEGSVLPDSYAYSRGEARSAVVGRMQKAMQTALANAWAARKPTAAVTTPEQAIILASIIEKETGRASERPMVGAVYTNRLKRGMPLQADPTFLYPITRGRPLGRVIYKSDLERDTPYNTYIYSGLPPGPITNPGKASIEAALDPAPSNAVYFVAQGDGSSAFADTLDQHEANVAKWRAHRQSQGNM
jgi:UPF0755 protein